MRILVTGATGNIGRMVIDALDGVDAQVRALTVDPARAALPAHVEVVVGRLSDPASCSRAFADVDRMYLAPLPDTVDEVTRTAAAAGVRRIVDLSGEPESWWSGVAEAVEASGVEWTHLWPAEFMENFTQWADQIRLTGEIRDAYPDSAGVPIAMADVAGVAAAALISDDLVGTALSLTGPEVVTRLSAARALGAALGREIPFHRLTRVEAVEQLTPSMGDAAEWYLDILAAGLDEPPEPASTVVDLTGSTITFAEWARAHVDEFR
ncbi:uncharacterized protein YbjT (DUF2867 family) [Actinoalloteichus hoggarensis]|uniref:NAD(P)H azoreductase n=1 Tax=Actinoalloteichus hoggarensis TaxID=1470176 RepID=A0A221W1J7_9PSEU|nr:NAD(P)H-binding protein [Actinoalloteichus hoggarensis]ASO19620.1 NAD(P)H azoreductase [Actinoalloteichus hoggarensis]MBB5919673.1 uncharacterized protein YbjT (DUF2867 family) [Actinoalloteichus hoggarensis]